MPKGFDFDRPDADPEEGELPEMPPSDEFSRAIGGSM